MLLPGSATVLFTLLCATLFPTLPTHAQQSLEGAPIHYGEAPDHGPVAKLQERLDRGDVVLKWDRRHGYLPSLLDALEIPHSSQSLVFSKTSLQVHQIDPAHPRALYFADDVYVGWVQRGDVLEIISVDPELGPVFYTLDQERTSQPFFERDQGRCLDCHASFRTERVPGPMIRSVFADTDGQPVFEAGSFDVDHGTPFEERWGGYYVTGQHGAQRHMGNSFVEDRDKPRELNRDQGSNIEDLGAFFFTDIYLKPGSDIVALMVLEHQARMQNLITKASYEFRMTRWYDRVMNDALSRDREHVSESSQRRVDRAIERLVRYMLFSDQLMFESSIKGDPDFVANFSKKGPRDDKGRSLRDLDLRRRLFRYPCSYMIYSESFQALPTPVKKRIYSRLHDILAGQDRSAPFRHLRKNEREAVAQMLEQTLPGF